MLFLKKFPKRAKDDVFVLNKVKNGPKRPYNRPKNAKNVQGIYLLFRSKDD